jgi:hypothetical protein
MVVVGCTVVTLGVTVVVTTPDVTVGVNKNKTVTDVVQMADVGYDAGSVVTCPESGVYVPVYTVTVLGLALPEQAVVAKVAVATILRTPL